MVYWGVYIGGNNKNQPVTITNQTNARRVRDFYRKPGPCLKKTAGLIMTDFIFM